MSQPISNLPVGSLVRDPNTKYNNDPIIWRVLEHGHTGDPANTTALEARDVITLKCFDAKEPSNSDSNRKSYGNNRYLYSNILQWLNSDAANEWYTAQHNTDQKPDSSNVWQYNDTAINPYDTEAGFLSNFSADLKAAIQTVSKVTAKNTVTDGGGYEEVSSKIFLLSTTEVGLVNENNVAEGSIYAYYSLDNQNSRRKKNLANDAAKGNYSMASSPCRWWLRTPRSDYSDYPRLANSDGSRYSYRAYSGDCGVSPAYVILSSQTVSDQPDANGVYDLVFVEKLVTFKDLKRFKETVIPANASSSNKLATMEDVNGDVSPTITPNSGETYAQFLARLLTSPTYDYTKLTKDTKIIIKQETGISYVILRVTMQSDTGNPCFGSNILVWGKYIPGSGVVLITYQFVYAAANVYKFIYNDDGTITKTDISSDACAWTNAYIQY